ncbi:uncharacterized protein LOC141850566 [Brevipalpus obovatus]|uniref:uncharacterized protein LOC141850566 n=1 Tax=Brevipalpus obovatus TaxID=246614 RepID=UPI003D9FA534
MIESLKSLAKEFSERKESLFLRDICRSFDVHVSKAKSLLDDLVATEGHKEFNFEAAYNLTGLVKSGEVDGSEEHKFLTVTASELEEKKKDFNQLVGCQINGLIFENDMVKFSSSPIVSEGRMKKEQRQTCILNDDLVIRLDLKDLYEPILKKKREDEEHQPILKIKPEDEEHKPISKKKHEDEEHQPILKKKHEDEEHKQISKKKHEDEEHKPILKKKHEDEEHQPISKKKCEDEEHKPILKNKCEDEIHQPSLKKKREDEEHQPISKKKREDEEHQPISKKKCEDEADKKRVKGADDREKSIPKRQSQSKKTSASKPPPSITNFFKPKSKA